LFTCILPDYVTNEIQKEFWKNSHFENTRTCFLLRCQNSLRQNSPKMMHFQAWKKKDFNKYYVVAFDPIKIYTHLAPQNDRLNLSFVKDIYVVAKKMARNDQKWPFLKFEFSFFFLTKLKNTVDKQSCNLCRSS
jgi:hypothetical protein